MNFRLPDFSSFKTLVIIILMIYPSAMSGIISQKLLITEFMALNNSGLKDEDGDFSDWIEIYNPGENSVDLTGWHLTDDSGNLEKWTFPAVSIGTGEYLVVFASSKDRKDGTGQLHTNFNLSGGGEYLALVEADSNVISYEYAPNFPPQQSNVSYGIYLNQLAFFKTPTPGVGNTLGTQVLSPVFSKTRGFYSEPFSVSLSVSDATARIFYTTNGTRPTATYAKLYTEPIQITTTTPLSAVCVDANDALSSIVTNTYYFINDIVKQPVNPDGYPSEWGPMAYALGSYPAGSNAPADYEMDPQICNNAEYNDLMDDALLAIPSLCIVTNPGYIFANSLNVDTGGIYIYTGDVPKIGPNQNNTLGSTWERPASVEYFDPADSSGFQINCGLRLHGGNSRKASNSPKHSFTLSFRSEYGFSKLNYDLFDEKKAIERFDDLVLRAGYNYSWFKPQSGTSCDQAQYVIDPFARKTLLDMRQVSPHGKFVHLYINGLYWGLYEISEKLNKNFAESYFGGEDTDYDVLNDDIDTSKPANGLVDGNATAYNSLYTLKTDSDPYNKNITQHLLDLGNFADYMLMNFYIGNNDWDKNNWFIMRNRVNPGNGFSFISWDAENSMTDVNINKVTLLDGFPTKLFNNFTSNDEFKLIVADRIQKHFFNNGALTAIGAAKRYEKLTALIDTAIIGESARWGDYYNDVALNQSTRVPYNLKDHWLPKKNNMMNNYFPGRSEIVLNQLKLADLFPSISAPIYNSIGGELTEPVDLTISATTGTIYFTIDGSDPRTPVSSSVSASGSIYTDPLHVVGNGTVKSRAKNGAEWSALAEVTFLSSDTVNFISGGTGIPVIGGNLLTDVYYLNSAMHYTLPTDGYVRLDVFSVDGRLISTLAEGNMSSGYHQSEWTRPSGSKGLYLYKLNFNGKIVTGKIFIP